MIFGEPASFALEAVIEPGPEFPPSFGTNVVGRFRFFFGGSAVGDFNEPCCVLGPLSQHLLELCSSINTLWHESLEGCTPEEQFKLLDDALFVGCTLNYPSAYDHVSFLTNVSEALDDVKGFLIGSPGESLRALLKLDGSENVHCHVFLRSEFCSVAAQFGLWLKQREHELLSEECYANNRGPS